MASTGEARRSARLPIAGLLLLAAAGLGPVAYDATHHADAPTLSGFDDPRVQRRDGEPVLPYVARVNTAVHAAIYHCEPTTAQTWATALLAPISSAVGDQEGILAPKWMRCGFCSQVSFVESEILRANGIGSAHGRGLDGHVVVSFRHAGRDYVSDPDLDVGPFAVDWDDSTQLARTAAWEYRDYGPMPHGMSRPIVDVFAETATDGRQYAPTLRLLAVAQGRWVAAVELVRWLVVVAGALMVVGAVITSRKAASRNGR